MLIDQEILHFTRTLHMQITGGAPKDLWHRAPQAVNPSLAIRFNEFYTVCYELYSWFAAVAWNV